MPIHNTSYIVHTCGNEQRIFYPVGSALIISLVHLEVVIICAEVVM
jgi:hypothetical protein